MSRPSFPAGTYSSRLAGLCRALALCVVCALLTPLARAQVLDIDTSFSNDGIATAAVDIASSSKHDRGVAVFPVGSGNYLMVVEAANVVANQVRIAMVPFNAAGTPSAPVVDTFGFTRVGAACQQPDGKVIVGASTDTMSGSSFYFKRFLTSGALDTSFNGTGSSSIGITLDEYVTAMHCGETRMVAVLATAPNGGGPIGTRVVYLDYATGPITLVTRIDAGAGELDEPRGIAVMDSGQVVIAGSLSNTAIPFGVRLRVYPGISNLSGAVVTDYALPIETCNLGNFLTSSALGAVYWNAPSKIVLAGSVIGSFNSHLWVLQGTVSSGTGAVQSISCGSLNNSGASTAFVKPTSIQMRGTDIAYVFGQSSPDVGSGFAQFVAQFRLAGDGSFRPDTAFNEGRLLGLEMPHAPSGFSPYFDEAGTTYFDTRPTVPRILFAGAADWANPDTDASLTRFILAPVFANGFE